MFCAKCGATVPADSAFCSACGQPVVAMQTAGPTFVEASAPDLDKGTFVAPPGVTLAPLTMGGYAGFWLRLIAFLIDSLILLVVAGMVLGIFGAIFGISALGMIRPDMQGPATMRVVGFFELAAGVGAWLYFALMESSAWQATLGKRVMGLYVTDLHGNRIGFGRASGRYFGRLLSNFTLFIGYIMAGFTAKKQALHDMIAGCLVRKLA